MNILDLFASVTKFDTATLFKIILTGYIFLFIYTKEKTNKIWDELDAFGKFVISFLFGFIIFIIVEISFYPLSNILKFTEVYTKIQSISFIIYPFLAILLAYTFVQDHRKKDIRTGLFIIIALFSINISSLIIGLYKMNSQAFYYSPYMHYIGWDFSIILPIIFILSLPLILGAMLILFTTKMKQIRDNEVFLLGYRSFIGKFRFKYFKKYIFLFFIILIFLILLNWRLFPSFGQNYTGNLSCELMAVGGPLNLINENVECSYLFEGQFNIRESHSPWFILDINEPQNPTNELKIGSLLIKPIALPFSSIILFNISNLQGGTYNYSYTKSQNAYFTIECKNYLENDFYSIHSYLINSDKPIGYLSIRFAPDIIINSTCLSVDNTKELWVEKYKNNDLYLIYDKPEQAKTSFILEYTIRNSCKK